MQGTWLSTQCIKSHIIITAAAVSTLQMGKLKQRDLAPVAAGHSVIDRNIQDCPAPVFLVSISTALLRILFFLSFTQHSVCKPCPHCYLTLSLWLFATSNRPEDTSVCESFYPGVDLRGCEGGWGTQVSKCPFEHPDSHQKHLHSPAPHQHPCSCGFLFSLVWQVPCGISRFPLQLSDYQGGRRDPSPYSFFFFLMTFERTHAHKIARNMISE